jgi:hypothetical protein
MLQKTETLASPQGGHLLFVFRVFPEVCAGRRLGHLGLHFGGRFVVGSVSVSVLVLVFCCVVLLCVVVLWCCGVVVLWCCGVVVLWCCGVVVLWCCGVVVLWCCGVVVLWCCGVVVLWCCGVVVVLGCVLLCFVLCYCCCCFCFVLCCVDASPQCVTVHHAAGYVSPANAGCSSPTQPASVQLALAVMVGPVCTSCSGCGVFFVSNFAVREYLYVHLVLFFSFFFASITFFVSIHIRVVRFWNTKRTNSANDITTTVQMEHCAFNSFFIFFELFLITKKQQKTGTLWNAGDRVAGSLLLSHHQREPFAHAAVGGGATQTPCAGYYGQRKGRAHSR